MSQPMCGHASKTGGGLLDHKHCGCWLIVIAGAEHRFQQQAALLFAFIIFMGSPLHLHSLLSWAEIFTFAFIVDIGTSHLHWLSWDWSRLMKHKKCCKSIWTLMPHDCMLTSHGKLNTNCSFFLPPLIHVWFTPHFASSLLGSVRFRLASSLFAVVIPLFLLVSSWCFCPAPSVLTTLTPSFASLSLVCEYFPPSSSTFAVLTTLFVSSLESFLYSACHCHVCPSPCCTWHYSHWRPDFSTCGRSPCIICNHGESYQLGWCCFPSLLLWKVKHAFRQWSTSEYKKKFEGFAAALTDKMATYRLILKESQRRDTHGCRTMPT